MADIPANTRKYDGETTSGVWYIGETNSISSDTSSPTWRLKRVVIQNNVFTFENAEGVGTPKFKWDDRATLTYK